MSFPAHSCFSARADWTKATQAIKRAHELFQCACRLDGLGLARFGRINAGKPDSDGLVLVEYGQGIAAADAEQGGCTGRHKAVCQQAGCEEEAAGRRHGAGFLQGKRKL